MRLADKRERGESSPAVRNQKLGISLQNAIGFCGLYVNLWLAVLQISFSYEESHKRAGLVKGIRLARLHPPPCYEC